MLENIMNGTIFGIWVLWKRSCENKLKKSSTRGSQSFFKVQSNCHYFVEWKKKPTFSGRNPCSNHLKSCSICKADVWTYNAKYHYSECHAEIEYPVFVSEEEIKKMKSK